MACNNDDWREGKTIAECNAYMLEKELACDIKFEVGIEGGDIEVVQAHKYMLMTRSPVFFAMFGGELRETGDSVRISDTEPAIFRDILQYLYTGQIEVTRERICGQMYAAEKYMLPDARAVFYKNLENNLDEDNACNVLVWAVLHESPKFAKAARNFILENFESIMHVPSFLNLSKDLLKVLLSQDKLFTEEELIFEACVTWGRRQCLEKEEGPTGAGVREAVGDCLQVIRFPLMRPAKFVELTEEHPDILTKEEELAVHKFYATGKTEIPFPKIPRQELRISRVKRYSAEGPLATSSYVNDSGDSAVIFQTDKPIALKGVMVCGTKEPQAPEVTVEVYDRPRHSAASKKATLCANMYVIKKQFFQFPGKEEPVKDLMFTEDLFIPPNTEVSIIEKIRPKLNSGGGRFHLSTTQQSVTSGGVQFTFTNCKNYRADQIPGLLFARTNGTLPRRHFRVNQQNSENSEQS